MKVLSWLGSGIPMILLFALVMAQSLAFVEGAELLMGIGWLLAILIFCVVVIFLRFATIFASAVAFYGAMYGWDWEWWQAALLCFPGLIFMFVAGGSGVVQALWLKATGRDVY